MWIFAAAVSFSAAAHSQTNGVAAPSAGTAPAPIGIANTGPGINTEPGYVPPSRPTIRAPGSTPDEFGTNTLGGGLDANSMGSDLSRLFDPTLPPGVGTGTAAPGGRENPSIPGR